jgi:hypothetical protein
MIPFQGLLANIAGIVALIRFWGAPLPTIWFIALSLFLLDFLFTNLLRGAIAENKGRSSGTVFLAIICTLIQFGLIGVGVYSVL